jgi:threonine/homoserine efflux transporter RhtA
MTDPTSFDLAVGGVAMPFIIALINQTKWNPKVRGLFAFLLCLGSAAGLAALHGTLTFADWRNSAVLVTGSALVMYHALWKPSGLAPAVESATSL